MGIIQDRTEFLMGIQTTEQLSEWLSQHQDCRGVAYIGRSNVGKSSMINAIFGSKTARTSKLPGRTRQVNVFEFQWRDKKDDPIQKFYLFDVPGYGHAEVSKQMARLWRELLDLFFSQISQRVVLMNIQDARHPLQDSDLQFHEYIQTFDLETYLIFNKMDKLKSQKERQQLKNQMPEILKKFKWVKLIYFTSAEKKTGVDGVEQGMMNFLLRQ